MTGQASSEIASRIIDSITDESLDMAKRTRELEARRMLRQLSHAGIPESVCEENPTTIVRLLSDEWEMCDAARDAVIDFVRVAKNWCTASFRIVIDGGKERDRVRIMRYCIYRAIIARSDVLGFLSSTADWPTVLPIVCDYKHPARLSIVGTMRSAKVLGLAEIDPTAYSSPGVEAILTSILRGRAQSGRPTVMTFKSVFDPRRHTGSGEIHAVARSHHDTDDEKVVRIRLSEAQPQ
jgi:hypothetical protein